MVVEGADAIKAEQEEHSILLGSKPGPVSRKFPNF